LFKRYIECILLIGIAMVMLSCGVQKGQFVTTSTSLNSLSVPVGSVDMVVGHARGGSARETDEDANLFYVLCLVPGVLHANSSSSDSDYGKYTTTLSHAWNTEKGMFSVSIIWDRRTDVITIGNQEFLRSNGNVLFVCLDPNGKTSTQQEGNLGPHIRYQEVVQYIQQQIPTNQQISTVEFYK